MNDKERRYQKALIQMRLACDEELRRFQAGVTPDPGLIVTMTTGEVGLALKALKAWAMTPICQDCGMRHAPDRIEQCIEGHGAAE
jgi:hypothetical protein